MTLYLNFVLQCFYTVVRLCVAEMTQYYVSAWGRWDVKAD